MTQEPRYIIKMIVTRITTISGHIIIYILFIRRNEFIINIMEGKINGKRGRPRGTMMDNLRKILALPRYVLMKRLAEHIEDQRKGKTFK